MELKEFIKETLTQIAQGISDAQESLHETGAIIAPEAIIRTGDSSVVRNDGYGNRAVNEVKFNVGVSAGSEDGTKAGIAVLTGLFSGGAQEQSSNSNQSITNIEFAIPMVYPPGDVSDLPKPKKYGLTKKN
jgi:hypothetical protein